MKDVLTGDATYDLWLLFRRASQAALKARDKELHKYGISAANSAVLLMIHSLDHQATPAEISRQIFREPHSVSGILKRMEKEGLVTKVKDLKKKNMVRVELTEKGRKAYNQSSKRESIHKILSALSEEERQQFTLLLTKIREKALKEFE